MPILSALSTGIGSAIAYFIKKPKIAYLSFSLGLSAGVMIYISFMGLLPNSLKIVRKYWGMVSFFVGIAVIGLIDLLISKPENPHDFKGLDEPSVLHSSTTKDETAIRDTTRLMKTGLLTTLAIGIHNFPEGLATFASVLGNVKLGIFIAIAIAIHNIPEGIAVSVPIFYATQNKNKAFFYSFLSGISEPVGATIGYLILMPFLTPAVLAGLLAFIAGMMVYISLDELVPMAHRYGHSHLAIAGVVSGMFIMALSLLML